MPFIQKLSSRVYELEKKFMKFKDVCINNRDELHRELRKNFLTSSTSFVEHIVSKKNPKIIHYKRRTYQNLIGDFTASEEAKSDSSSENSNTPDANHEREQQPLYMGERLRVAINEYLNNEGGLDEY